jgi:hypothetical protein
MIRFLFFSLVILINFTSCNYVDSLFQKEVKRIDFTNVDVYPVFKSCDSIETVAYKQSCFEKTVSEYIYTDLLLHEFVEPLELSDALIIHIKVDKDGTASFLELESSAKTQAANSELKQVIRTSIAGFPKLTPAKKRGVYVSSMYMIPLYIIK